MNKRRKRRSNIVKVGHYKTNDDDAGWILNALLLPKKRRRRKSIWDLICEWAIRISAENRKLNKWFQEWEIEWVS